MGQIITTGSYPRLLLGDITNIFGAHYNQLQAIYPLVFKKKSSERNFEEAVQIGGMGEAAVKGEGAPIELDGTQQGYVRRTTHKVWHKAAKITMEAMEDNRHLDQAKELAKHLARALMHTKEKNAAALFNNATSTSAPFVGADGKALLASDHPLAGGGTFSNIVTSDLSELALENAKIAMSRWVDNGGLLVNANVRALLHGPDNRFEAHRILNSDLRVGTPDNDANAIKNLGDIPKAIQWNHIDDTNCWFLLTDIDGLVYYERMAQQPSYEQEALTKDHIYSMMERYSFDYFDPRCVYGSMGSS